MELRTKAGRAWLEAQELSPTYRQIVDDSVAMIDALAPLVRRLDREVWAAGKDDPRVQALIHLPGVGEVVALMLVAEIGDIARFPTARKLCAWAGSTPAVRNSDRKVRHSDRKVRHGHIPNRARCGCGGRWGEAAQVAKNRPPLQATYTRILHRRGSRSPRWSWPESCWPERSTSSRR